ncbi:branched-chain amino acid ABC transporter permease [Oceanibacterium hippocampi]|uniref:High-affinity branched-chain amino acid transport system permease protein LivH n=1 Tax=Oceanibacterium hippocampi TaxID=745714 RepID=A0A1Y5THW8_9PROT|nr:branched-chain amino acid ABC transporter permease [Oceanibacterium hippocampi]SLN64339.1 High-affinity branched-chain amino acid transport system permease protein LivH [Oceanibacterium hippocampi]
MGYAYYVGLAINGAVEGLTIGLAALAINLVFAVGRFPNATTGDLMTVGAYAGIAVQQSGLRSLWLQGLAAVGASMALSLALYLFVFRALRGRGMLAPLLASIGLAILVRSVLSFFAGHDQYVFQLPIVRPIMIAGIPVQSYDLWLGGVALVCVLLVMAILFLSPIGRQMRAVADDLTLARTSGINVDRVYLVMWLLVGFVTGVAGMVLGVRTVVMPEMGWNMLLPAFAAAVLGGVGSPAGAVLAAMVVGIAQEMSTPVLGFTYKIGLAFMVLVVILAVRPAGLFGRVERVR